MQEILVRIVGGQYQVRPMADDDLRVVGAVGRQNLRQLAGDEREASIPTAFMHGNDALSGADGPEDLGDADGLGDDALRPGRDGHAALFRLQAVAGNVVSQVAIVDGAREA